MKILSITDLHGSTAGLKLLSHELASADLVLITGDITHFGGEKDAARIINEIRKYNEAILAVHGNCDFPDVDAWLKAEGISLHGTSRIINGVAFVGAGASLPCPGKTPNELEEDEFKELLDRGTAGLPEKPPLVLVIHQPPRATVVDRIGNGMNVGSQSVLRFIRENKPLVCFCGHIHEARGSEIIGETRVVNPGPLSYGGATRAHISDKCEIFELTLL